MSLEPMEKPSQSFENSSAIIAIAGVSAINHTLKSLDFSRPSSFMIFRHFSASHTVLITGSIIHTFFSFHSSLHFLIALHSSLNAFSYHSLMYLLAPRQPSMGFASTISYFSPPFRSLYSFVLKSLNLTTTGRGCIALATVAIPSASLSTNLLPCPVSRR